MEIELEDSLEHCLGKTLEKHFGGPILVGFEIRIEFLPFSQGSIISFS